MLVPTELGYYLECLEYRDRDRDECCKCKNNTGQRVNESTRVSCARPLWSEDPKCPG